MKIVFITLIIFLSGCTTIGKPFHEAPPPNDGESLIYIFRAPVSYGNFWITNFLVDGEKIVSLYDKGYSWIHLPPGEHVFSANTPTQNDLSISGYIEPNSVYYIGYGQNPAGYNRVENVLKTYNNADGARIISQYSYKSALKIQTKNNK